MSTYADWSANMFNHLLSCNQGYGKIIWLNQQEKVPITYDRMTNGIPGIHVDLVWIARALWSFIFDHVTQTVRRGLPLKHWKYQELN